MKKVIKFNTSLFWSLVSFAIISMAIAGVSIYFFTKMDEVYKINSSIHSLYTQYVKISRAEADFFNREMYDVKFFKTGQSESLASFKQKVKQVKDTISDLKNRRAYIDFGIANQIDFIDAELTRYESLFQSSVDKAMLKGFRDYGIEGKMREFVHELEKKSGKLGLEKVLMMRRHEKDYLLRNDEGYIKKLTAVVGDLKSDILKSEELTVIQKDSLIVLLYNYYNSFTSLVSVGKEIGNKDEQGLSKMLAMSKGMIETQFDVVHDRSTLKENFLIQNLQKTFVVVILNLLVISILLVFLFFKYRKNKSEKRSKEESMLNVEHVDYTRVAN